MEEKQTPLIMIDDVYGISVDPIDYSLRKVLKSEKTGKIRQEIVGYFSSIRNCLKAYTRETIHDCLKSNQSITLKEAINRIEDASAMVYGIINEAFPEFEVTVK